MVRNYYPASLALGGGGLKGAAHVGVLKFFEEEKLPIDCISGNSAGALIGALYGLGYTADELSQLIFSYVKNPPISFQINPWRTIGIILVLLINFLKAKNYPTKKALLMSKKLDQYIEQFFGNKHFEDLKYPLLVTAVDLRVGRLQVFTTDKLAKKLKGIHDIDSHGDTDLATAIRASIAVPGIFKPVYYQDMILVDGGIKDQVPADLLRYIGATRIVAVNLGMSDLDEGNLDNLLTIILQTVEIMGEEIADLVLERYADIVITPPMNGIIWTDFQQIPLAYERGYQEARKKLKALQMLLGKRIAKKREV